MNAAFAIGRLCDMEASRNRLLKMPECDKMVNTQLGVHVRVYRNWVLGRSELVKRSPARNIESSIDFFFILFPLLCGVTV